MRLARLAVAFALLSLPAAPAFARSEKTLAYLRDQAWPAAVRFIRVDEGLKIIEKDADAGYVLFELHEEKHTFRGSLEVITVQHDDRAEVRFVITIDDRPSYLETAMLERLERKLHDELGSPSPAPTRRDPPPKDAPSKDAPPARDAPAKDAPKDPPPPGALPELPRDILSPTP